MGYRDSFFKDSRNAGNHGWYKCVRCGRSFRKGDMDIDHIVPQMYGGSDSLDNLQCLCKHCNRSKGADVRDAYSDFKNNLKRRDT